MCIRDSSVSAASVKTGKTTPPKHFTEDTLLAAMENAGKEDMPDDAERKHLNNYLVVLLIVSMIM